MVAVYHLSNGQHAVNWIIKVKHIQKFRDCLLECNWIKMASISGDVGVELGQEKDIFKLKEDGSLTFRNETAKNIFWTLLLRLCLAFAVVLTLLAWSLYSTHKNHCLKCKNCLACIVSCSNRWSFWIHNNKSWQAWILDMPI